MARETEITKLASFIYCVDYKEVGDKKVAKGRYLRENVDYEGPNRDHKIISALQLLDHMGFSINDGDEVVARITVIRSGKGNKVVVEPSVYEK